MNNIDEDIRLRLKTLLIKGFKSFNEETKIDFSKETAFIGTNGSGKTACLLALNKLFSYNASDRIIHKSDFYINSANQDSQSRDLYIEAVFELDKADEDEDKKCEAQYWNRLIIKNGQDKPLLRIRLESTWTNSGIADGTVDTNIYFMTSLEDNKEENKIVARRSELSSIQFIYVPAVRNPERQLSNTSDGMISQLIKSVNWDDEIKQKIVSISSQLNDTFWDEKGSKLIQDTLNQEWKSLEPNSRFSNVKASVSSIDINKIMSRIRFEFNSNVTNNAFSVDEMSDGIKSLFYISNIASVLAIENRVQEDDIKIEYPVVTIFALEEPENHISPHLLGKVMDKVKSITKLDNTQTIITSHSPAIIKRVLPEDVRYFHLTKDAVTEVKKIKLPDDKGEKYKFIKRAVQTYPELYFSKLVILGEGESEEIVLSKIISSYTGLDEANISIVPLAGRMVNYLWDLLESLNIAHITLLDLDYGRYLGGKKRIKDIIDELKRFNPNDNELEKIEKECTNLSENKKDLLNLTKKLENYDVFFSFPLDLDFMMLAAFSDEYKNVASRGPKTTVDNREKILDRTLKGKREEKVDYDDNDIELMRWYNTLFLGIGKPLVHFTALENIPEEELGNNLPEQLKRLLKSVKI